MCFFVCGVVGCIPCASGFVCMFAHMWFCVSVCIWCEFASPYAPGGTEASANYKKQRNNLHNLAFDLCHPQSSFALTQLPSCFPSPAGSIFELCLLAALASPCHPMTGTGLEKGNEPSLSAYGAPGTCTRCLTYILKSLQQSRKV